MRTYKLNLPKDKQMIVNALLDKIEQKYKNDIAIVVCYGSYISGTAQPMSDIDFYFIPKTNKGYEMNLQFIIDDIGYDFWALSWRRAERIASFAEPIISIIADGIVIYYSSSNDLKRFSSLQESIQNLKEDPERRGSLLAQAERLIEKAKGKTFTLHLSQKDFITTDAISAEILGLVTNAVAFINGKHIQKAVYNVEREIEEFRLLPENYLLLFKDVISCKNPGDKTKAIKDLIYRVDRLLKEEKGKLETQENNFTLAGFYEEMKSSYNKLHHACNCGDYLKAYFTAHMIDAETRSVLGEDYLNINLPSLIIPYDYRYFDKLEELSYLHERILIEKLQSKGINILEFNNVNEFSAFLK